MDGLVNSVDDAAPSGGVLYPPYEARPADDKHPSGKAIDAYVEEVK